MNLNGSTINKTTATIFTSAFIATLMAVFTAAAIMPDETNVLAHDGGVSRAKTAQTEEGDLGECPAPVAKGGSVKRAVTRTSSDSTSTRTQKELVEVKTVIKDVVDVTVKDVVDIKDFVHVHDINAPILSNNNVLNDTLSNNNVNVDADTVLDLLN